MLFVCVNSVGIFHRWMTEHDLKVSNQKREEFSAIRSKKEIKKYQQVKFELQLVQLYFKFKIISLYNKNALVFI